MSRFRRPMDLPLHLREMQRNVEAQAKGFGLSFFPVLFEVVPYNQMNELAAYGGFPVRYPHWRFGMEYEQLSKSYEYGLSKIYEMVINTNPSVAYLLEGNSLVDQKLVMAHVYAHVDFFTNNFYFSATNQGINRETNEPIRRWIDTMANHGATIRKWSGRVGVDKVEEFIDVCLTLENLIDPQKPFHPEKPRAIKEHHHDSDLPEEVSEVGRLRVDHSYMEGFINTSDFLDEQRKEQARAREAKNKIPEKPDRDVLGFLIEHAPLERWERDVLQAVREEAYYFWPQMQTKIMNEGWASYWHSRLMTEKLCDDGEIIEYAERNAGVMETSGGRLNPYKLGVELYRNIEDRWNRGQFGKEWEECDNMEKRRTWDLRTGLGRQKIFEVRKLYNDVTFIDEFLTPEFAFDHKLYAFGYNPRNERFEVESRQFKEVKEKLVFQLTNAGQPFIYVSESNHGNRGELLLEHDHMGMDLRVDWAKEVLKSLVRIWRRPVEIRSKVENKPMSLRFDGTSHQQRS